MPAVLDKTVCEIGDIFWRFFFFLLEIIFFFTNYFCVSVCNSFNVKVDDKPK